MTLTIVNHCHDPKSPSGNTLSLFDGEPNGAVKKLLSSGYHLNPRVHANPVSEGVADGSQAELSSSASGKPSTPPFIEEGKSGESSVIFGKDLVMD